MVNNYHRIYWKMIIYRSDECLESLLCCDRLPLLYELDHRSLLLGRADVASNGWMVSGTISRVAPLRFDLEANHFADWNSPEIVYIHRSRFSMISWFGRINSKPKEKFPMDRRMWRIHLLILATNFFDNVRKSCHEYFTGEIDLYSFRFNPFSTY